MAQRKRAGLITRRTHDRNVLMLINFCFLHFQRTFCSSEIYRTPCPKRHVDLGALELGKRFLVEYVDRREIHFPPDPPYEPHVHFELLTLLVEDAHEESPILTNPITLFVAASYTVIAVRSCLTMHPPTLLPR